ncbi:MAG: hypothetical protein JWP36_427 [Paucimonas sp.]|nr:hypothetical protein [Paucimonas sp.]
MARVRREAARLAAWCGHYKQARLQAQAKRVRQQTGNLQRLVEATPGQSLRAQRHRAQQRRFVGFGLQQGPHRLRAQLRQFQPAAVFQAEYQAIDRRCVIHCNQGAVEGGRRLHASAAMPVAANRQRDAALHAARTCVGEMAAPAGVAGGAIASLVAQRTGVGDQAVEQRGSLRACTLERHYRIRITRFEHVKYAC